MSLTKVSYSMINGAAVNVLDYGADPTGVADSTAAIQAAIDTGKTVWIPNGTYSVTSLNLKGKYPNIVGDGINQTIIKARSSVGKLIDAYESSDVQISPVLISNLTIDGDSKVTEAAISMRYRHLSNIDTVVIKNVNAVNSAGLFAVDCWLTVMNNSRVVDSYNGINFYGSNHRSTVNSCSFVACSNVGINCDSNGTAADGNMALVFNNCDVEFGTGLGAYLDVTSAAFYGCYMGENLNGSSFYVDGGNILVDSGVVFFGHTTNSFAVTGAGGFVTFRNCKVSGQTNSGVFYLMSGGLENFYKWEDCTFSVTTGGTPVISGDRLDYGPPATVFAQRLGKNFTDTANSTTKSTMLTGASSNGRRVTCLSVTGVTPIIGLQCNLIDNAQWVDNEGLYFVMVYKASTVGTLRVQLSGGSFGIAPFTAIVDLPNSASTATIIKLDQTLANSAYTILEFLAINCAANDYIEIEECYLADNRMLQKNIAAGVNFRNLYKC